MIPNVFFFESSPAAVLIHVNMGESWSGKRQMAFFFFVSMLETRVARHPLADIDVGVAEGTVGDAGTLADWKQNWKKPPQKHPKTQK